MVANRWWKGPRGEWYVVAQFALFIFIAVAPRIPPNSPAWGYPLDRIALSVGGLLLIIGGAFTTVGFFSLGTNLAILPRPKENGMLVVSGAYRLVRHPIYSGIFSAAVGWGIWNRSLLLIGYALLLFIVMDLKARREERWLSEKYPEYKEYLKKVRRFIPYIY